MEKKVKNRVFLLVSILLVITTAFLLWNTLNEKGIISLEKMTINAKVTLGDHNGLDVDTSVLSFGNVTSGSYASRNITINNDYDFPVVFDFYVKGNISEFLVFPKRVYLKIGEEKEIVFIVNMVEKQAIGHYTGEITAAVKKAV